MDRADEDYFASIGEKLAAGRLIPFLGAGANLCDRGGEPWSAGQPFLPSGRELAEHLAERGRYPDPDDRNLLRVSQYVRSSDSEEELYYYLREVFGADYAPTSLHRLLARVARLLADSGKPQLLTVTTNYDDLLEQALADEGLKYDVVWYEAKETAAATGRFVHRAPGKRPKVVARPNKYAGLPMTLEHPVVLKLHGALVRDTPDDDSYVITEDSYIDYLAGGDVGALIPIALWQRLTTGNFLFLGYSLTDWNLRVILNRIWGTRKLVGRWWAVQREPDEARHDQERGHRRADLRPRRPSADRAGVATVPGHCALPARHAGLPLSRASPATASTRGSARSASGRSTGALVRARP